ncbi:MAG: TlpA disulfide reductase family protein [Gammaproteobacteria bacterium]|jgi:thiol-disulfide isomerase/thioredoxin
MRKLTRAGLPAMLLAASVAHSIEVGDIARPWGAVDFDGRDTQFPDLLDAKPAVVIFWATWCPHCKAFMPYLREIQTDYGDHINVVAVNIQEDGSGDPRRYIDDLDFPMIAVPEGDRIAADYGIEFVPSLLVLDADASVVYVQPYTTMPAGDTVAGFWARQVRRHLNRLFERR